MSSRARAAVNFPRYAGNVPDSEELFADAASDSFRGDAHGGITSAFPLAPRVNYPDGQAGDDDAGQRAVRRQCRARFRRGHGLGRRRYSRPDTKTRHPSAEVSEQARDPA